MRELVIIIQASIVPSIPERAEQEELPSKFEVLENTRDRYRDNIIQSQRVFQGDSFADDLETIEPEKKKRDRPEQQEKPQPAEKDTAEVSEINNDNEEKPPVIVDPEVDNQVIELDFDDDLEAAADTAENIGQGQISEKENNAQDESPARFFIIGGSFRVDQNAIDLRNSLRTRGFDALIIPKEGTDISMVAYGGYSSFDEARAHLAKIQENQNANAWIYRMD